MLKFILPADCGFSAGVIALGIRLAERAGFLIALAPREGDLELGLAFARDDPQIAFGSQRSAEFHLDFLRAARHMADRSLDRGGDVGQRAEAFSNFSAVAVATSPSATSDSPGLTPFPPMSTLFPPGNSTIIRAAIRASVIRYG